MQSDAGSGTPRRFILNRIPIVDDGPPSTPAMDRTIPNVKVKAALGVAFGSSQ